MATTAAGVTVPAGTDAFNPQVDMSTMGASLAGRIIVPVANTTARAAYVSSLTTAGTPPSTSNPVFTFRADATPGREIEYTTTGTTWVVVAVDDTGWITPTLLNGWSNFGSGFRPAAYRRVRGEVQMRGAVKGGTGVIFNLPAGFRPGNDEACISLSNVGGADLRVASPTTTGGTSPGDVSVAAYLAGGNNGILSLARPAFTADA